MSNYTDASLIMYPSGYKASKLYSLKPTDGSGDLTFTRASTATRVNSAGLIEKARTNLILQSNTFSNASWTKSGSLTVTGGQAGYNGTNNAWLLTKPAAGFTGISQTHSNTGIITGSFYLKAGTLSSATIRLIGTPDVSIVYNLTTGTITSGSGFLQRTITSVGEGWYRCTVSINSTASSSFALYPDTISATTAGTIFAQNAQLETGDIATDYIPTTTAAVSVGMTANVPRLDYSGGGCPKLLLEPQRTNEVQFSEQPDNAYWTKSGATILTNTINSPSGYVDADKLQEDSSTGVHRYGRATFPSGTQRTFSVFAKKGERNFVSLFENNSGSAQIKGVIFNLNTGALSLNNDAAYYTNPKITDYGNGWYRCSVTWTPLSLSVPSIGVSADGLTNSYAGTTGNGIYIYGAQVEAGAYVSSYIPTLASSVTRLADAASKTGISSLIGQTEGTLFVDAVITGKNPSDGSILLATDKVSSGAIIRVFYTAGNALRFDVFDGTSFQAQISAGAYNVGDRVKVAAGYKANDFVLYVNGTQIGTDTSGTVPATDVLNINTSIYGDLNGTIINQALLFKTRLTNTQLAELTTI